MSFELSPNCRYLTVTLKEGHIKRGGTAEAPTCPKQKIRIPAMKPVKRKQFRRAEKEG